MIIFESGNRDGGIVSLENSVLLTWFLLFIFINLTCFTNFIDIEEFAQKPDVKLNIQATIDNGRNFWFKFIGVPFYFLFLFPSSKVNEKA